MAKLTRRLWIPAIAVPVAIVAFAGGVAFDRRSLSAADPPNAKEVQAPDFSMIQEAWSIIDKEYVDRSAIQTKPLTYGAITGIVDALGDTGHSAFLTPDMVKEERSLIQGRYVGVGLEIETRDERVTIVAPLDNSPALKAGLHAGQEILKVDGSTVGTLSLGEVVQRISGPAGTSVTLTIFDPKVRKTFDVTLKRAEIHVVNVTWQPVPGTPFADLRVAAFSSGVTDAVKRALEQIQQQGFEGVVLDLRNDPGGELEEAIGVASQFLKGGNVLQERDAQGTIRPDPARPGGIGQDLPLTVLINEGTASASEIVAGALQDAKRATLVGETTFGTGTVLDYFRLADGSALLLATREWLTPKGRTIWHKGVVPDRAVALATDVEPLTPSSLKGLSGTELGARGDAQLQQAVALLREQSLAPARTANTGARSN